MQQRVEVAEVLGQRLGGRLADVADAERVDEARERGVARFFQRVETFCADLAAMRSSPPACPGRACTGRPRYGSRPCRPVVRSAGRPALRRRSRGATRSASGRPSSGRCSGSSRPSSAPPLRPRAHDGRAAHRAGGRHDEFARGPPGASGTKATTSGITSPARRTMTVSPMRMSLRRTSFRCAAWRFDVHAADEHRGQARHRRDRAGASDLHADVQHLGQRFFGRELVGHRKARRARNEAQLRWSSSAVDLVDHAVDLVRPGWRGACRCRRNSRAGRPRP
jgi:hypothetical protein